MILVFAAHLLAANVATAGPFVCLWLLRHAYRRGDAAAAELSRDLAGLSIYALLMTIVLGSAALGLVWQLRWTPFVSAAGLVPTSRYWFGVLELIFYLGCMFAYVRLHSPAANLSPGRYWTLIALGLLAGTDVAYHFPPLFAVIVAWSRRPETWQGEPLRFISAMLDPEVLAVVTHFLLASVAVTGTALALLAERKAAQPAHAEAMRPWITRGAWLALVPTALQLVAGMLVLVQLPDIARDRLLGGDLWATSLFGLAVFAALGLMHRLAAVALGEVRRRDVVTAAALMAVTVVLMAAVHEGVR